MGKMTVAEAAEHYNISKEAIHNRVRRGTLDSVIEHGTKYILVGEARATASQDEGSNKYYEYIEQENLDLKAKIAHLEDETKGLRDQREMMLIAEKEKIEAIYKERDAQLKNVLQVIASKFITHHNVDHVIDEAISAELHDAEAVEVEDVIEVEDEEIDDLISLKAFLKLKMYSKKEREKIKKRFEMAAFEDKRILVRKRKVYLRPNHFDYGDLIR